MKVGDWVVCTKGFSGENGPKEGKTYQIKSIQHETDYYIWLGLECAYNPKSIYAKEISSGERPNWGSSCFRLLTPEELEYINFPNKLEELLRET